MLSKCSCLSVILILSGVGYFLAEKRLSLPHKAKIKVGQRQNTAASRVVAAKVMFTNTTLKKTQIAKKKTVKIPDASLQIPSLGKKISGHTTTSKVKKMGSKRKKKAQIVFALISVKKCGSGCMKYFVEHHPSAYLIRKTDGCMDIPKLRRKIRAAKLKYPKKAIGFTHHSCTTAPETFATMGDERPDKLVILLCDPVRRAFSDFHNFIVQRWFSYLKKRSFSQIVSDSVKSLTKAAKFPAYVKDEEKFGKYLDTLRLDVSTFDQTIVSRGVYFYDVAQFLSLYSRSDILFVTGKELIQDPANVMKKIQKSLGIPMTFRQRNFVLSKSTGFYCLAFGRRRYCMGASKSKTTGKGKPTPGPIAVKTLKKYYKPFNQKLFDLLGYDVEW